MRFATLKWTGEALELLDQRLLPHRTRYVVCKDEVAVAHAIRNLTVRGAPAIGAAAAYGVALAAVHCRGGLKACETAVRRAARVISESRPTARNLFWAVERMTKHTGRYQDAPLFRRALVAEARSIELEDKRICRKLGAFGARLIRNGDRILTHCNAGALATVDYGTALGVLYAAKSMGKRFEVYADETRPVLQGARLTAWELAVHGVKVTLICDNMAADLMRRRMIDKVIVGADRIAANGDVANKIGTYGVAVLAKAHGIPFYVAAPLSTFDVSFSDGSRIPIEQRNPNEVFSFGGVRVAPHGVRAWNPAFDVTPSRLVTAIITETGVLRPPYRKSIAGAVAKVTRT